MHAAFGTLAVAMGLLTLIAATILVWFTTALHARTLETVEAFEGMHRAAVVQQLLREHRITPDGPGRASLEARALASLSSARAAARDPDEAAVVDEVMVAVRELFGARDTGAPEETTNSLAGRSYGALSRLMDVEVAAARRAESAARRWDRAANVAGVVLALLLVLVGALLLAWLRRIALAPLVAVSTTMQRYAGGESSLRAEEDGALELRDIARRFNEMADALERREREQYEVIASIAHDLRTPLAALKASTTLAHGKTGPARDEVLAVAGRQADRLATIVDELLDVARLGAGELRLNLHRTDVSALVRDAVSLFRATSAKHDIHLKTPHESLPVRCDATRIMQVLTNLLSNAIKYSPAGGVVHVVVGRDGDRAEIRVADEGIGIPEAERARVFEAFHRTPHARASAAGAGLGLFGAKRIVDAHGGVIALEGTSSRGTIFTVKLPIEGPPSHPPVPRASAASFDDAWRGSVA